MIGDAIRSWLGVTPESINLSVPTDKTYPTNFDAENARAAGFAAQSPFENFLNNETAQILGTKTRKGKIIPISAEGMRTSEATDLHSELVQRATLSEPESKILRERLNNLYMKGALAANRSAIASVGFDPKQIIMDSVMQHGNVGGLYRPGSDSIYANLSNLTGSAIVHESIHRGLERLRRNNPEVDELLKNIGSEELTVRYIMATMMGDPEKGDGDLSDKQRQAGLDLFQKDLNRVGNQNSLAKIEKIAQEYIKNNRKGPK